jgi:hypothetical protein
MASKSSIWKGFPAGAWTGACFGLTSTLIVMGFSTVAFPKPIVFAVMSAILSGILLVGGVVGFSFFSQFSKGRKKG